MTGGHLARKRTAASIQARAYWPTWSSDLDTFLRECQPCAQNHRGSALKKGDLRMPLVGEPWFSVSIDITGPHPRSSMSNQYILTLVDHFSKWAEAIPLRNHTAPTVTRALMVHIFVRFGAPRQLLSNGGIEFESELFSELMKWMDWLIEHGFTSAPTQYRLYGRREMDGNRQAPYQGLPPILQWNG